MFEQKKKGQPKNNKHFSAKAVKFNRFLLLRYSLALFFFVNLNWLLTLYLSNQATAFLPLLLLIGLAICLYEQLKVYNNSQEPVNQLTVTRGYLIVQGIGNGFLIVAVWVTNSMQYLFPFLHDTLQTRSVITAILVIGIGLVVWNFKRLEHISQNKDKYYENVLKTLKFESE